MSPSTHVNPSRTINWLFYSPANAKSELRSMTITGHSLDIPVERLEWVASLEQTFNFRADKANTKFWTPSTPLPQGDVGEGWIKDHPNIDEVARFCQPVLSVSKALEEYWDPDHVHFLITVKAPVEDAGPITVEEGAHVPELPLHIMHHRFREGRVSLPVAPSTTAEGQHRTIHTTIAPPVEIFHPVFQEFLDRIEDPAFKPDREGILAISKLTRITMGLNPEGYSAFFGLRSLLDELLGVRIVQVTSTGARGPDGMVFKWLDDCLVPLVCIEYKRTFVECNPSTLAADSLREFLVLDEFKRIFEKCCCPSFLLAGGGPDLLIFGVVFTDKFIVQPLTSVWAGADTTHEDARVYHLARVFGSLRLALTALDEHYGQVSKDPNVPALVLNQPHPRFFPYSTRFKEYGAEADAGPKWTEFEYIDAPSADPTNVTFIVRVKSSDQKLVVKIVCRYGVEAHQLLADAGMAPRLLYCGLLNGEDDVRNAGSRARGIIKTGGLYCGPIRMVVMEHIEGDTVDKVSAPPKNAREKTEETIQKLHDAQLVFGNLRPSNVMLSWDKLFLIDFDWAGRLNEARYPMTLPRNVRWPREARELEMKPILMDHDWFMLDQLFPK